MERMENNLTNKGRICIITSALLALFLGALDALVMSAAMPSIVADLGGLHLYAWVYSAYLLSRAVSLPIFGKLSDLFNTKRLFLFSIVLFLLSSIAAGMAQSMAFLVAARVFQGISAGGNFALVYIVLSDVALPGKRARTISLAATIWGISSVIGPTLGGFIVTYFSWRWIFFINIPIGILSLLGVGVFLKESRKKRQDIHLDIPGITFLTGFVLGLLTIFIIGGREYEWTSLEILTLTFVTVIFGICFLYAEKRAKDPLVNLGFFQNRTFSLGNCATFFSSFSIFALFGYAPLFIQGALEKSPMQVGIAMLSLSLGWSYSSFFLGRYTSQAGGKKAAVPGGLLMLLGSCLTLGFSIGTSMIWCFLVFQIIGIGMGLVTLSTLVMVQNCMKDEDLGITTSFHQFSRSMGGTIGVGICGGIVTTGLMHRLNASSIKLPQEVLILLQESTANLFNPEFQQLIPEEAGSLLQKSVAAGLSPVFWLVATSSLLCLISCLFLPGQQPEKKKS